MLDKIRRKFSNSNVKAFYNQTSDLGNFMDLVYYKGMGIGLSVIRSGKKVIGSSFRYAHETSNAICLKGTKFTMIKCTAGYFVMGCEGGQNKYRPRHERIASPFLLGETEVTQELYEAVMGYNPSFFQASNDECKNYKAYPFNLQHPVEQVGWHSAVEFCNKLSVLQGLDLCYTKRAAEEYAWDCDFGKNGYRLPTEKEWEYAAKAGTANLWSGTNVTGNLEKHDWFQKNSEHTTQPVKKLEPNEWGFHDMGGNVGEWCWDKELQADTRIIRGGSMNSSETRLWSHLRDPAKYSRCDSKVGFRVCRTLV